VTVTEGKNLQRKADGGKKLLIHHHFRSSPFVVVGFFHVCDGGTKKEGRVWGFVTPVSVVLGGEFDDFIWKARTSR
jgi:hypothetical protein